jgi:hypothetical protein
VRIVAVGEGVQPEMVDYGWIEDVRSGRTVWEMTWRNTHHAGGAHKNRMFNDVIRLEAGEYEAFFVTDDSHAWGRFNQPQPDDPTLWGITISEEGAP